MKINIFFFIQVWKLRLLIYKEKIILLLIKMLKLKVQKVKSKDLLNNYNKDRTKLMNFKK